MFTNYRRPPDANYNSGRPAGPAAAAEAEAEAAAEEVVAAYHCHRAAARSRPANCRGRRHRRQPRSI